MIKIKPQDRTMILLAHMGFPKHLQTVYGKVFWRRACKLASKLASYGLKIDPQYRLDIELKPQEAEDSFILLTGHVPFLAGIIAERSITNERPGADQLVRRAEEMTQLARKLKRKI